MNIQHDFNINMHFCKLLFASNSYVLSCKVSNYIETCIYTCQTVRLLSESWGMLDLHFSRVIIIHDIYVWGCLRP